MTVLLRVSLRPNKQFEDINLNIHMLNMQLNASPMNLQIIKAEIIEPPF